MGIVGFDTLQSSCPHSCPLWPQCCTMNAHSFHLIDYPPSISLLWHPSPGYFHLDHRFQSNIDINFKYYILSNLSSGYSLFTLHFTLHATCSYYSNVCHLTYSGSSFNITILGFLASPHSGPAKIAAASSICMIHRVVLITHAMNMGRHLLQSNNTFTVNANGSISSMPLRSLFNPNFL